jgi:hypothetical protein
MSENVEATSLVDKQGKKVYSFVNPLFAEQPDIVWDRVNPILRTVFAQKYGLCNKGLNPKHLRVGTHCIEEDVEKLFGPCVNQNGYKYCHSEDEEFVKAVEWQWMVCHQRTGLPNTRLINKAEARGLTCERLPGGRRRDVNWAHFAEWTCRDQLRRIQSERDSKEGLGAVHIKSEGVQGGDEDQRHDQDNDNLQQRHQGSRKMLTLQSHEQVKASMVEWRLHLASLENKMPLMEVLVDNLSKKQAVSDLELVRVESQLVDLRQLVISATRKLTVLQLDVDAQKGRML